MELIEIEFIDLRQFSSQRYLFSMRVISKTLHCNRCILLNICNRCTCNVAMQPLHFNKNMQPLHIKPLHFNKNMQPMHNKPLHFNKIMQPLHMQCCNVTFFILLSCHEQFFNLQSRRCDCQSIDLNVIAKYLKNYNNKLHRIKIQTTRHSSMKTHFRRHHIFELIC